MFNLSGRYPIWNNQDVVYFHGTTKRHADAILREGIDPARGDPNTDFGRGFYTTTNMDQAEEWAQARAADNDDIPVVLKLSVNRGALARLRNLSFVRPTEDYWSLVERCRDRKDAPYPTGEHYDVISGPVAKRWFGSESFTIHFGYDQTSFHGDASKAFLNDFKLCRVEVAR